MKLVLAIEYPSLKPLAFLVFPGDRSDSKIFDEIVTELIRRKILRKGDFFVLDKGFYAYKHYIPNFPFGHKVRKGRAHSYFRRGDKNAQRKGKLRKHSEEGTKRGVVRLYKT